MKSATSLLSLPPELILLIADHLPRIPDVHPLLLTSSYLQTLISPYLLTRYTAAWNMLHTSSAISPLNSGPTLPRSHITHTPLHSSLKSRSLPLLISFSSNINHYPQYLTSPSTLHPSTPLTHAILLPPDLALPFVKALLRFASILDPQPRQPSQFTASIPLLFAVHLSRIDIAEALLDAGHGDVQMTFHCFRWAPLQLSLARGDEEMWKLLVRSRWDRRNIGAEVLSYGFEGWKGRVTVGDAVRAMGSQEMGKVVFTGKGTEGWKRGMRDEGMCRVLEECLEMEVERCRGSRWGERGRRRIEEGGGLGRCVVRPAKPVWPWVLVMAIVVAMAGR